MDTYKKLFQLAAHAPTSQALVASIALRIRTIQRNRLVAKTVASASVAIASGVALVPAFSMLAAKISTAGFYQYAVLAFSGDGVVYLFWKELLWSLVETLPLVSLVVVLSVLLALVWSGTNAVSTARRLLITA